MPGYFKPSRVFSLSFIEEVFDTYFLDESFYKKKYGVTDRDKVVYTMAIYSHIYGFLWFFVPLVFFRSLTWSSCKTSSSFLCFLFFIVLYFILFTIPFGGNLSGGFRFRLPFESILLFILSIWLFKKTTSAGGRKNSGFFQKSIFTFLDSSSFSKKWINPVIENIAFLSLRNLLLYWSARIQKNENNALSPDL